LAELLIVSALAAATDLLFFDPASLFSVLPYAVLFPLVTSFYGLRWGFPAFALACAGGAAGRFLLADGAGFSVFGADLRLASVLIASLASSLLIAFIRNRLILFRESILGRLREAVHHSVRMRKQGEVLEKVNHVLESRVSSQKDSITILHDQVRKLASLSLDKALETILETVALFTEMSSGVIWTLDVDRKMLVPAATWGWPEGSTRDVTLDLETTIEGYVFRNRKPFSVRMLLDNAEFDRFSTDRTLITLPIVIGSKSWGVINVEDLPFERYSQYTETILAILLSLAEPYLRRITEYETLNALNEVDPETGHPLYSILYKTLTGDLERIRYEPGFVSLVILEIINFDDLLERWSREQIKRMLFALKDDIDAAKKMKTKAFHFKDDGQLVLLVYDLDHDGTSFFCLDLLAMFSGYHFTIDDTALPVELVVGFSSSSQSGSSADGMISAAEYLLSVQRL